MKTKKEQAAIKEQLAGEDWQEEYIKGFEALLVKLDKIGEDIAAIRKSMHDSLASTTH